MSVVTSASSIDLDFYDDGVTRGCLNCNILKSSASLDTAFEFLTPPVFQTKKSIIFSSLNNLLHSNK